MEKKQDAVLMGPFVGEFYWEAARFAPILPHFIKRKYKNRNIKYIILTRKDRFDLYGQFADIMVPLNIEGDYVKKMPECFRLIGFHPDKYESLAKDFKSQYSKRFNIVEHIFPSVRKPKFLNKNQFPRKNMIFKYRPRKENYDVIDEYIPNDKPLVVLGSRYRKGFRRNWERWQDFYDLLWQEKMLKEDFNFIICGKKGEYVSDKHNRYLDITNFPVPENGSLAGLLLVILSRAVFTFGSQSAIPNLSLLHGVDVLEFGCQKGLHTKTYNVRNTPITFIVNPRYNIKPRVILNNLKPLLKKKKKER